MLDVVFDMETGDPDDPLTLLLLCSHKSVKLRGITVYPGSKHQIGVVKQILKNIGIEGVPVGARTPDHPKESVEPIGYSKMFGKFSPQDSDGLGHEILAEIFTKYPHTTMITGAPLGNLYDLLEQHPDIKIQQIFTQGGFAGANCIPSSRQFPQFRGRNYYHTFNFDSFIKGAHSLLNTQNIKKKHLISKDITHSVFYTHELHKKVALKRNEHPGWNMMYTAMDYYLKKRPRGKKLHDPLAACVAIDPNIVRFKEVMCYHSKDGWGCVPTTGTNLYITIDLHYEKFESVFLDL